MPVLSILFYLPLAAQLATGKLHFGRIFENILRNVYIFCISNSLILIELSLIHRFLNSLIVKKCIFFSELYLSHTKNQLKTTLISFKFISNCIIFLSLLVYISTTGLDNKFAQMPRLHFGAIVVFLAWLGVTQRFADFPTCHVYFEMLQLCAMVKKIMIGN